MSNFKLAATTLLLGSASAYHARRQVGNENPEVVIAGASSYNGLNLVPQMGWNNWNVRFVQSWTHVTWMLTLYTQAFHCDVSEDLLLNTAQDMVDLGLRDLGYNYIVLDDCVNVARNENGYLIADGEQVPRPQRETRDSNNNVSQKVSERYEVH
jgi:alpha-galactosidase